MKNLETDDTFYSTNYVGKIIEQFDLIEDLDTAIAAKSSERTTKSVDVYQEVAIEFEGKPVEDTQKESRDALVEEIRAWLDPSGYLEQWRINGRVIPTL